MILECNLGQETKHDIGVTLILECNLGHETKHDIGV